MCSGTAPVNAEAKGAAGVTQEVTACAGLLTESTVVVMEGHSQDRKSEVLGHGTGRVGMGMTVVRSHGKLELLTVTAGMWGTMNEF